MKIRQSADYITYEYLGVHRTECGCLIFRVFAPDADAVFLVGDFCSWDMGFAMDRAQYPDVWEIAVSEEAVHQGDKYKFKVLRGGDCRYVADPYSFATEAHPGDASVVCEIGDYEWRDSGWLAYRHRRALEQSGLPMNIYELDLDSWKRRPNGDVCSYGEIARELAPYVKQMGYTHIAFTPVTEYSRDAGDTFEVSSYFAPASRFGTPREFKAFVDNMHEAGIGVILELEISAAALSYLDVFGNNIECFFSSCVLFWTREYHADGMCINGGRILADSTLDFLKPLKSAFPDVLLLSADILDDANKDGVVSDILRVARWSDRILENGDAQKADVIGISRKDVSEDKRSFLGRMEGERKQKFARVRTSLGYMMTYPAAKLTFMGTEIGQPCKRNRTSSTEWSLLDDRAHSRLQTYVARLNHLYLSTESLHRGSFELIETGENGLVCYRRATSNEEVVALINLTGTVYESFCLRGAYKVIFNSDSECFGGEGILNTEITNENTEEVTVIRVPPISAAVLKRVVERG